MKIAGAKVLVTGANRGLGKALVQGLRDAGAAKPRLRDGKWCDSATA